MRAALYITVFGVLLAAAGCVRKETVPYDPPPFVTDPVFYAYCMANFDLNGDGYFAKSEAAQIKAVDLDNESGADADVASLAGIWYFTALQSLDVAGNSIAAMNIRANVELTLLECADNKLGELDISKNTLLTSLSCRGNADDMTIWVWQGFDPDAFSYYSVPDDAIVKVKE